MRAALHWLLRFFTASGDRAAIVGDLEEAYRRDRARRGWLRAELSQIREVAAAIGHAGKDRMRSDQDSGPARASFIRRFFIAADVRYALRRWRRRPGFPIAAIATLGIGIGATTAIYSVIDTVLLALPPWTDPDRLVSIHAVFSERRQNPLAARTWNRGMFSYRAWDALRDRPEFEDVAVWRRRGLDTTFGVDCTDMVEGLDVSSNFLPILGIPLAQGRTFTAAEDTRPSASVIITHEAWQRLFSGRADIIGQQATVGSASSGGRNVVTIVGVVSPGFSFDGRPVPELLFPVGIGSETGHTYPSDSLRVVARFAPGRSREAAGGAAEMIARAVETREPTGARIATLVEDQWRGAARPIWVLFGGAALLLLVACANVAGLLLGEARVRRHGSRSAPRSAARAPASCDNSWSSTCSWPPREPRSGSVWRTFVMQTFVAVAPAGLPRVETIALDPRIAAFALAAGGLTLLLFGVAPAISVSRTRTSVVLAEGGRDGAVSRLAGHRLVVAGAMALALVLLVGASLLGETLYRLTSRALGFDPTSLAVVSFRLTTLPPGPLKPIAAGEYQRLTPAEKVARTEQAMKHMTFGWWLHMEGAMDRIAALPSVIAVGGAYSVPLTGARLAATIRRADQPASETIAVRSLSITGGYFDVMRIPVVSGRALQDSDRTGEIRLRPDVAPMPRRIVISRELERRLFSGSAVGQRILQTSNDRDFPLDVVGIVGDSRWRGYSDDDLATFYTIAEGSGALNTLFVRTAATPAAVLPSIRATLRAYDPRIVVTSTTSMSALVDQSIAEERLRAALSAMFGGAALLLAAVGLYSLAARRVADRRREIGVRVALGARPRDVRRLVLRDALLTAAAGLAIGTPLAYMASQVTQSMLFGVTATAPRVFLAAAVTLAAASIIAALLPARRAATIDPILVLKE